MNANDRHGAPLGEGVTVDDCICSPIADPDPFCPDHGVDMVNHPPHYTSHPSGVECIEITRHLTFDVGNAFKYVFRCDLKNGRQDIEKARFYLDDAIRHADKVFLSSWRFTQQQLLDRVIAVETGPHRLGFFTAIKRGLLANARAEVTDMLRDA